MNRPRTWSRFLAVWLSLLGAALFLQTRSAFERTPRHQPLQAFPRQMQEWSGEDLPLSADALEVLGPGEFLSRTYRSASLAPPIDLFVAYYPSQRSGDTIHSPQNCLPGAGWSTLQKDRIYIPAGDGKVLIANRYVVGMGMERVLVLYWYQAHGRTTPSEYRAKIYLVEDSIKLDRSDGAMIRIATSIPHSSDEFQAETRAVEFARAILPTLDSYIPR